MKGDYKYFFVLTIIIVVIVIFLSIRIIISINSQSPCVECSGGGTLETVLDVNQMSITGSPINVDGNPYTGY